MPCSSDPQKEVMLKEGNLPFKRQTFILVTMDMIQFASS